MFPADVHLGQTISRRAAIQAGAIGWGLSTTQLAALQALTDGASPKAKSVIFIFLTGGLSHQDTFDMKPEAPVEVRGEFKQISTRTAGLQICEHLPLLAQRSDRYALLRSMQTNSGGHLAACHMLFTGRMSRLLCLGTPKKEPTTRWKKRTPSSTSAPRGSS